MLTQKLFYILPKDLPLPPPGQPGFTTQTLALLAARQGEPDPVRLTGRRRWVTMS